MDGAASDLASNGREEFYLGMGGGRQSFKDVRVTSASALVAGPWLIACGAEDATSARRGHCAVALGLQTAPVSGGASFISRFALVHGCWRLPDRHGIVHLQPPSLRPGMGTQCARSVKAAGGDRRRRRDRMFPL